MLYRVHSRLCLGQCFFEYACIDKGYVLLKAHFFLVKTVSDAGYEFMRILLEYSRSL